MVVDMLRSTVEDPGWRADTRVGSAELGVKDLNLQPGPLHCIVSCDFDTVGCRLTVIRPQVRFPGPGAFLCGATCSSCVCVGSRASSCVPNNMHERQIGKILLFVFQCRPAVNWQIYILVYASFLKVLSAASPWAGLSPENPACRFNCVCSFFCCLCVFLMCFWVVVVVFVFFICRLVPPYILLPGF